MKVLSYICFYLIQWTWGALMNIVGGVTALVMLITGHKPYAFGPYVYFRTKWNFGGVNLGMFFIIGDRCDSCAPHEMGHGIQNMMFGPLMPFIVCLPSAYRYWLRTYYGEYERNTFAWVVAVIAITVTVAITILGIIFATWLAIVGACLLGYVLGLHCWSLFFELPRYEFGFPDYDSVWIEGYATKCGEKMFKNAWWIHVVERNAKEGK